jgi:hypothetical protein
MRPTIQTLSDALITRILEDAKRILAEVGVEVCGQQLKQRLLDRGLRTDNSGPKRFRYLIATATFTRRSVATTFISYRARAG